MSWTRVATDILDLAFSPDEAMLASGGMDGTVRLWDFETGRALALFAEHSRRELALSNELRHRASPCCLVFSPRGDLLLSAHEDSKIRAWRVLKTAR